MPALLSKDRVAPGRGESTPERRGRTWGVPDGEGRVSGSAALTVHQGRAGVRRQVEEEARVPRVVYRLAPVGVREREHLNSPGTERASK